MNATRLPNIVYTRDGELPSGASAMTARLTNLHPDGTTIENPDPTWPILWRSTEAERGILRVEIADVVAADAPATWFVYIDEPKSNPPAAHLVAFASDLAPAGTIITRYQFATMGIRSEEQAGAVRWYPRDGLVHQIFVTEEWRRRQLGTQILYVAGAFHQSMGWHGKLHGDGRRTALGEQLTATLSHPGRVAPLSATMPPMDPSRD